MCVCEVLLLCLICGKEGWRRAEKVVERDSLKERSRKRDQETERECERERDTEIERGGGGEGAKERGWKI